MRASVAGGVESGGGVRRTVAGRDRGENERWSTNWQTDRVRLQSLAESIPANKVLWRQMLQVLGPEPSWERDDHGRRWTS